MGEQPDYWSYSVPCVSQMTLDRELHSQRLVRKRVFMKRPPAGEQKTYTPRGASTRQRIVDATASLAYTKGIEGTSLDDVRAAAGVSKSQLYHYFADKDALVREVISAQTARVLGAQRPHSQSSTRWQGCVAGAISSWRRIGRTRMADARSDLSRMNWLISQSRPERCSSRASIPGKTVWPKDLRK